MVELLTFILVLGATFYFGSRRALRYLQIMQQDEYSGERFWNWYCAKFAFDRRVSIVAVCAVVLLLVGKSSWVIYPISWLGVIALFLLRSFEPDPLKAGKLPLILTARAKRIWLLALLFLALDTLLLSYLISLCSYFPGRMAGFWLISLFVIQAVPMALIVAVRSLEPYEEKQRSRYIVQAKKVLANVDPFVIGVTGSYGKTSVKVLLGQILRTTNAAAFWPQGGTNTLMGVTREIREGLLPEHRFAVVEMAAYREGSIAKLCELTRPKAALITAIDNMHLERFGSREVIYRAKTELIRALAPEGVLVLNGDDAGTRRAAKEYSDRNPLLYGFDNSRKDLACWISEYQVTTEGTKFSLTWQGQDYQGKTKLLGRPALSNIMAAFTMSCAQGSLPEFVLATIQGIEPVDNRLSLEKSQNVIWLKDAYNSNPVGFSAALEVLEGMPANQRVLMTPGMVELGGEQSAANKEAGRQAAEVCDLAIIVGHPNREALIDGLKSGGLAQDKIVTCADREEAFSIIKERVGQGDAVLIENDLPDLHDQKVVF